MTGPAAGGPAQYPPKIRRDEVRAALEAEASRLEWMAGGRPRAYRVRIDEIEAALGYCTRCRSNVVKCYVIPEGHTWQYPIHLTDTQMTWGLRSALAVDGVEVTAVAHRSVGGASHDWLTDVLIAGGPYDPKGGDQHGASDGV